MLHQSPHTSLLVSASLLLEEEEQKTREKAKVGGFNKQTKREVDVHND